MTDVLRQYNGGVVATLEEALQRARQGKAEAVAIILTECPPHADAAPVPVWAKYCANTRLHGPMETYLKHLTGQVGGLILNNTPPERGKISADYACFNAAIGSMSFDFANWLVARKMEMIAEGEPGPLKVGFFFGRDGKAGLHDAYRRRMFERVVRPMLDFVGAVESDVAAQKGRVNEFYCSGDVCDRVRNGEKLPQMWATDESIDKMLDRQNAITITLREADEWAYRNSNIEAWLKFAGDLKAKGERVIFVRDTAQAYEPVFDGFEDCPQASTDLHVRMALYQLAKMNFFVSNGPVMLAIYGYANYRVFLNLQPDGHSFIADTPKFWREKNRVEPGGQFPWALPNQRIMWAEDRYENISAEWERRKESAAA